MSGKQLWIDALEQACANWLDYAQDDNLFRGELRDVGYWPEDIEKYLIELKEDSGVFL